MAIEKIKSLGRIGVLMGGASSEREISLKSGNAVLGALKKSGVQAISIDIKTENIAENIRLLKESKIDCAFIAMHGRFGEDGQLQALLDSLKIIYSGSGSLASRLAMDKVASRKIFQGHNLAVPRYTVLNNIDYAKYNKEIGNLALPWVIKPATHGSSVGLSIIEKKKGLSEALNLAFNFDKTVIIEEYIPGREMTVGILDEQPLPVIEIIPKNKFFDYQAKYQYGMTEYIVPAKLEEAVILKLQSLALSAHKLLGCKGFSRADIILDTKNTPYILELNSIPGLTPTSLLPKAARAAGIEFEQLCLRLVELAYEKAQDRFKTASIQNAGPSG